MEKIRPVWQEIEFVAAFTNPSSATFANARQSALHAGYSPWYARNIRSHFPPDRIVRLQRLYKNTVERNEGKKIKFIEVDAPLSVRVNKQSLPRRFRPESFKGIKRALDALIGTIE